jgi:hypothetical protein
MLPKVILGLGYNSGTSQWEPITVGRQVTDILTYAISVGVDLQVGIIPDGEILLQSEATNAMCAELIRGVLRLHPDWVPWIDHSTTPPTFHVTPVSDVGEEEDEDYVAGLAEVSVPLDGTVAVAGFSCVKRDDMLPLSVRTAYEYASTIDGEVYRAVSIDKWPTDGPDGGPRVLSSVIHLAGMKMQIQKSRIQTRTIPTDETHAAAKSWLKLHFPQITAVPDANFDVNSLTLFLIPDDGEDFPPPINPEAVRLAVADATDLPRELIRGAVEDWMRVKVGKVSVRASISKTGTTTAAEEKLMGTLGPIEVTATNATTKTYKGVSQWAAAEDLPTGISQAVYEAIHASMPHQGFVSLIGVDLGATRYHGKAINLTESAETEWATMAAPVHSVDWDAETGVTKISFGPIPRLAPADFLELQRMFRSRPVTWMSGGERGSDTLGGDGSPSAKGDTVGGHDHPGGGGGVLGGRDLNLTLKPYAETTLGGLVADGSDMLLIWRDGRFAGTTDPGDSPAGLIERSVAEVHPSS